MMGIAGFSTDDAGCATADMRFDDFVGPSSSKWAHAQVETGCAPYHRASRAPRSQEPRKEEKPTLKMKEELTLCSEKLWN